MSQVAGVTAYSGEAPSSLPVSSPRVTSAPSLEIPRVLYQTYSSKDLPEAVVRNRDVILRNNPGWNYEFFDDEARREFIARECSQAALAAYDAILPCYGSSRADLFKYLLIYRRGGLYLDLKSSASRPLDEIVARAESMLLTQWNRADSRFSGWGDHAELRAAGCPEYQQWYLLAAPQHPYMKAVCDRVLRNIARYIPELHGVGSYGVLRTTGPIAFSLAVGTVADPSLVLPTNDDVGLVYTIYETAGAHRSMFTNKHYSDRSEPIVKCGQTRSAIGRGLRVARSLSRMIGM